MRVLRGRAGDIDADRAATRDLLGWVGEAGEPAVRVHRPHRQVAFGRRDTRAAGYERARDIARDRGYEPVERAVGGRAVAYTDATVAFARIHPDDGDRTGIDARYRTAAAALRVALSRLGIEARPGEPSDSFCPGSHSLQAAGKLVGVAQRVRGDAALVGGVVVVRDHAAIASVLGPIYDALDAPFDPDTVGSIARAGGDASPDRVVAAVERALVAGAGADPDDATVERVRET
jgi:lipoate-protein ligase A